MSSYTEIVNKFVYKAVWGKWLIDQTKALEDVLASFIFNAILSPNVFVQTHMNNGGKVIVIGDGRYDSPGYNGFYCTYTFIVSDRFVILFNNNV